MAVLNAHAVMRTVVGVQCTANVIDGETEELQVGQSPALSNGWSLNKIRVAQTPAVPYAERHRNLS